MLIYVGCDILVLEVLDLSSISTFSLDFMLIILSNINSEFKYMSTSLVLLYSIQVYYAICLLNLILACGFVFVFSLIVHHSLLKYW